MEARERDGGGARNGLQKRPICLSTHPPLRCVPLVGREVYFPPPQPDRPDYAVSIRIRCAALGRVRGTAASLLSQHLSAPNAEEHSRTIINM